MTFIPRQLQAYPVALAAWHFLTAVSRGFRKNQGLMMAGAIAYYGLLSLIPLLILCGLAFAQFIEPAIFLATAGPFLEWLVPSQSQALLKDIASVLDHGATLGIVLLGTMLFFSSIAFSVVDKAMHVIFAHRVEQQSRHPLVATAMPYFFVFLLAMTILVLSIITLWVQGLAYGVHLFAGHEVPISRIMLYGLGLSVELASFSLIYWIVPVGGTKGSHALLGGAIATAAWEILRHLLLWYLTTMSNASIVYGSLTTAVVAMLSMEAAATVLLIGAQAIAEYEIQGINRDAQPIP